MARWNEEQDRWLGRGDRYGEDERRLRGERGEEGGWRGRDWREDDRFGEGWRGGERGGDEWGERGGSSGERGRLGARYGEPGRGRWGREGPEGGRWAGRDPSEERWQDDRWRGERWREEPWRQPGWEERRGHEAGAGAYREERWERGGVRGPMESGRHGVYGAARSEYPAFGMEEVGRWREMPGWERRETRWRPDEEERGPVERMGDRIREGFRKLTGRGPKGYRRSDERIREDVCERIARSGVDAEQVEVKVERGEVTLTGHVPHRQDKRLLEDLAEDVFGVEEVHDHLRVQRPGEQATGSVLSAGSGTSGTGTTMSGHAQGTRTPQQQGSPPGRH